MEFKLKTPSNKEFQHICNYIKEFELDDRELMLEQFVVAVNENEILGFGRLRKHKNCVELCSLGVVTPYRRKGLGKAIVAELTSISSGSLYLVCIIPDFFIPLGFTITHEYPSEIKNKLEYCIHELVVPETYVVMLFQK